MSNLSPIVVVLPVKNEAWIIGRFLRITSLFADSIIVADQQSTDSTREICSQFPKVSLIENPDTHYDELARQRLLIKEARRRHPGPKVILALDADELLSADSLTSEGWTTIRAAAPGTTLLFDKPDILHPPTRCRPAASPFPLGYVDDGREHGGSLIHSARIPSGPDIKNLAVEGIRFLHLAMLREKEFFARQRYYAVVENLNRTKSWRQRIQFYSVPLQRARLARQAAPTPAEWTDGWRAAGIDVFAHDSSDDNLFTRSVLQSFQEHGVGLFHWDDI